MAEIKYSYMVDTRYKKPDLVRSGPDGFKRYNPRAPEKWEGSEFLDAFKWGGDDFVWYDDIDEKAAKDYMKKIDAFWKEKGEL